MMKFPKLPQKSLRQYKLVGAALVLGSLSYAQIDAREMSLQAKTASQNFAIASTQPSPFEPVQAFAQPQVIRQDFFVTSDPKIRIFVREVLPSKGANDGASPVLLIHGGGPGGIASFDLDVPNYSLAADIAAAGHPVYIMNVRGWEQSSRPPILNEPAENNPPAVSSQEAVRDISAVVDAIRQRNQDSRVALFGWATGGHWAGMYTSQNNDKVSQLVMLNSLYGVNAPWTLREAFENPARPGEFNRKAGAYRLATAEDLIVQWDKTIPIADKSQWRDPAVTQAYQQAALASDPTSNTRTPPSVSIPAAFRLESYNLSRGQKYWDAADITVPTLVIRGERDFWSRPEDMRALEAELVNAPTVETVTIPDGTHYLFNDRPERGRELFLKEVLAFLSKQ